MDKSHLHPNYDPLREELRNLFINTSCSSCPFRQKKYEIRLTLREIKLTLDLIEGWNDFSLSKDELAIRKDIVRKIKREIEE